MPRSLRRTRVRLWQAGDMPGEGDKIMPLRDVRRFIDALFGLDAFGYTHKPVLPAKGISKRLAESNARKVKECNDHGVTINLSANNLGHADQLADLEIGPVVSVLPTDAKKNMKTPAGRKVVICPAVVSDHVTCAGCGGNKGALCARNGRDYVVGFPAHGFRARKATEVVNGTEG